MRTKNFKNYILILAILNYRNWLDASLSLTVVYNNFNQISCKQFYDHVKADPYRKNLNELQNIYTLN